MVVVSESLECALEVALEHARANDLLAFLALRTCLGIVFTHVLIVSGAEANNTLLALVANVNTYEHGLWRDLRSKIEPPKVSAKLRVYLPQDIDVDSIIVLLNRFARHKLGNHWTVSVDLVLQSGVQMLLLDRIRHDDEEEVKVLGLPRSRKLSSV